MGSLQNCFNKIAAPITPATGPLSMQNIGVSANFLFIKVPPELYITWKANSSFLDFYYNFVSKFDMYDLETGKTYELKTAVLVLSYSRHSFVI